VPKSITSKKTKHNWPQVCNSSDNPHGDDKGQTEQKARVQNDDKKIAVQKEQEQNADKARVARTDPQTKDVAKKNKMPKPPRFPPPTDIDMWGRPLPQLPPHVNASHQSDAKAPALQSTSQLEHCGDDTLYEC
jgi:hypothetical protein